jgi:hypothetical protein
MITGRAPEYQPASDACIEFFRKDVDGSRHQLETIMVSRVSLGELLARLDAAEALAAVDVATGLGAVDRAYKDGYDTGKMHATSYARIQRDELLAQRQAVLDLCDKDEADPFTPAKSSLIRSIRAALGGQYD